MQDVIHVDSWWQWARRAGFPAQTKHWGLRMARGIRDPAMEAAVVLRFYPHVVQSCGHLSHLCARPLAACGAKKALDLPLVLRVMRRGILHGQWDHGTDATKFTAGTLAAVVTHELPWDAIRKDGCLEDFHHLRNRLPLIQPTGDDRAGMIVKDGNQIAIKAVVLTSGELTDIHRPQDMRRQRFKGVPVASRAWHRWHRGSLLAQDTLYGSGRDAHALVVEKVCQSLFAKARMLCFRTQHGIKDRLRFGGAVDMGCAITGGQTPLLGLMTVFVEGVAGDTEETGDHHHAEDMRRAQTPHLVFEVLQSGLNLYGQ